MRELFDNNCLSLKRITLNVGGRILYPMKNDLLLRVTHKTKTHDEDLTVYQSCYLFPSFILCVKESNNVALLT